MFESRLLSISRDLFVERNGGTGVAAAGAEQTTK